MFLASPLVSNGTNNAYLLNLAHLFVHLYHITLPAVLSFIQAYSPHSLTVFSDQISFLLIPIYLWDQTSCILASFHRYFTDFLLSWSVLIQHLNLTLGARKCSVIFQVFCAIFKVVCVSLTKLLKINYWNI